MGGGSDGPYVAEVRERDAPNKRSFLWTRLKEACASPKNQTHHKAPTIPSPNPSCPKLEAGRPLRRSPSNNLRPHGGTSGGDPQLRPRRCGCDPVLGLGEGGGRDPAGHDAVEALRCFGLKGHDCFWDSDSYWSHLHASMIWYTECMVYAFGHWVWWRGWLERDSTRVFSKRFLKLSRCSEIMTLTEIMRLPPPTHTGQVPRTSFVRSVLMCWINRPYQ